MKMSELHEARYIGGGKGSLEWLLNKFFTQVSEATEDDPHNEYHIKPGFHIYDRSGRRVLGVDTWKTVRDELDWSLTIARTGSGRGTMSGAYDPIAELTIFAVEQLWGPKDETP